METVHKNAINFSEEKIESQQDFFEREITKIRLLNVDNQVIILVHQDSDKMDIPHLKRIFEARTVRKLSRKETLRNFPLYSSGINLNHGNLYNIPVFCTQNNLRKKCIYLNISENSEPIKISIYDLIRLICDTNGRIII